MATTRVTTTKIYKPAMLVGQVYARPYGETTPPIPVGNVLQLALSHTEDVISQPDMTKLGGGTYAEVRRVKEVGIKMELADLNTTNLQRALLGTSAEIEGDAITGEAHTVLRGGLLRLKHIAPQDVVVKTDLLGTPTPVTAAGNFEVRPEGIYILPDAKDLADGDEVTVDYTFGEYVTIEALTTKSQELELTFGGLNEADSGKPVMVEVWRASQGVAKELALLTGDKFATLEVEGNVLKDPTKTGQGVSPYYKTSMA
jgi:hypothetical protein